MPLKNITLYKLHNYMNVSEADYRLLADDELSRAKGFLQLSDKNRYIYIRSSLRRILGRFLGIRPEDIKFEYNIYGKPYLSDQSLFFSVSHTKFWSLIALSNEIVGVDIETHDNMLPWKEMLPAIANKTERMEIKDLESFYKLWCMKESLLKAIGMGFLMNPTSLQVNMRNDESWINVHLNGKQTLYTRAIDTIEQHWSYIASPTQKNIDIRLYHNE